MKNKSLKSIVFTTLGILIVLVPELIIINSLNDENEIGTDSIEYQLFNSKELSNDFITDRYDLIYINEQYSYKEENNNISIYSNNEKLFETNINGSINSYNDISRIIYKDNFYIISSSSNLNSLVKFNENEISYLDINISGYSYLLQSDETYLINLNKNTSIYKIDLNTGILTYIMNIEEIDKEIKGIYHNDDIYKVINNDTYFVYDNNMSYYSLFHNKINNKESITYSRDEEAIYLVSYTQTDLCVFNNKALATYNFKGDLYLLIVDTNNNKYYYNLGNSSVNNITQFSNNIKVNYICNNIENTIIIKL